VQNRQRGKRGRKKRVYSDFRERKKREEEEEEITHASSSQHTLKHMT
jgi:hypothetical protein